MPNSTAAVEQNAIQVVGSVHPLQKSYMLVSTKHVDYENLDAFEAVSMAAVLFLAVLTGTLMAFNIG